MQARIGRYQIKDEVGRGGMAVVYHAIDSDSGHDVAIKVLPNELLHDPAFRKRFEREAELVLAINHPYIVRILDFGEDAGRPFVVMPFMNGGTLADRISEGIEPHQLTFVLDRIAEALDHAHAQGIVHRDVKPKNILFDRHGAAFLGDFGLVRMAEGASDITGSGVIGTPAYMAPELTQSGKLTASVDIYALAATIYEGLTGSPPFKGDTPIGTMVAHVTQSVPDVTTLRPGLPEGVSLVIQRGMAKNPRQRYPTAGELARDFRAALAGKVPRFTLVAGDTQPIDGKDLEQALIERARAAIRKKPRFDWRIAAGIAAGTLAVFLAAILLIGPGREDAVAASDTPAPSVEANLPAPTAGPTTEERSATSLAPGLMGGGGQYIAFVSNRGGDDEIWLLNLDTGEQTPLTQNEGIKDTWPAFSPDGRRIAFVSNRDGNFNLYVMDLDGSNLLRLTDDPGDDLSPAWSPDGTQIAFTSDRAGDAEIYLLDVSAAQNGPPDAHPLTDNAYNDLTPAWSLDGLRLVYTTYYDGNGDIAVISAAGTGRNILVANANEDLSPAWSPDGTRIAFASNREKGQWDIYVMAADGTNLVNLTNSGEYDAEPFWSPDGQWIVFSSGTYPFQRLFRMRADGSERMELTAAAEYYYDFPAWQPAASR